MEVIFHGVRGSTPVPLANFHKFGGNTTCIEIRHTAFQIILDAGTGFQNVEILGDRPSFLLFSHFRIFCNPIQQLHFKLLPSWIWINNREIKISSTEIRKQRQLLRGEH